MSEQHPENIIAHVSWTTTVAPTAPTVVREWRATVARNGVLVGQYVVTISEGIANADLKCTAKIEQTTTWCDVKVSPTASPQVWNVTTFGGGVGADIGLLNLAGAIVHLDFTKVDPG